MVVACCREKSAAVNVFGRPAATTAAVPPLTRTLTLTRVVFVCWLQYIVDLAVPEAQWIKPEIANGEHVDWLRICGWMTTRRAPYLAPTHPPPQSTHTLTPSKHTANNCRTPRLRRAALCSSSSSSR